MRSLSDFATEKYPLHPSAIAALMECPWRVAMGFLFDPGEDHGTAGDTGSAMHAAAAAFHRGSDVASALEAMGAQQAKYPMADLVDAANLFLRYARDSRNAVATPGVELAVAFSIEAAAHDPTQERIAVIGTCDQVREIDGRLTVWDIKTSKKDPIAILQATMFQLAAYCVGASVHFQREVHPGGIIAPRKYYADGTGPVFWHCPWKYSDIPQIMMGVRLAVANVRAGNLYHVPNSSCTWCQARSPDVCLPKLQEVLDYRRSTV